MYRNYKQSIYNIHIYIYIYIYIYVCIYICIIYIIYNTLEKRYSLFVINNIVSKFLDMVVRGSKAGTRLHDFQQFLVISSQARSNAWRDRVFSRAYQSVSNTLYGNVQETRVDYSSAFIVLFGLILC